MKPAKFDYLRPRDLAEAVRALAAGGEDARLLAGGQSLGPMLNLRVVAPSLLVDLSRLAELGEISERGDSGCARRWRHPCADRGRRIVEC